MAAADHAPLDAERLRQSGVQAVGHYDEPRGQLLAARQHEDLPVRAVGDAGDLGADLADARGDLPAHGIDECVVDDAVTTAALCLHEMAVAHDVHRAVVRGPA